VRRLARRLDLKRICRAFGVTLTRLLQDGDPDDLQALGL
jgi:hypothetical protein